jgi:predicted nucleotidyltransferase
MDLIREFGALVDTLHRDGVEYAVCGGIAVTIHGYVRTTKDIDLMIRHEDAARAVQSAAQLGFLDDSGNLSFDSGTQRERTVRRVVKIEGRDLLMLDLLLVSPVLEPAWRSRMEVEWEGRRVSIVSRDGLALMKSLAGRDQDLTDLKQLGIRVDG